MSRSNPNWRKRCVAEAAGACTGSSGWWREIKYTKPYFTATIHAESMQEFFFRYLYPSGEVKMFVSPRRMGWMDIQQR